MKEALDLLDDINGHIVKVEKLLVCTFVLVMIIIAFGQVVLRNTLSMGFLWVEHLTRILILWVTFLGASLASLEGKHICMDLMTRYVSDRKRKILETIAASIVICCCFLLFMTSLSYIQIQRVNGVSHIWPGSPDWIYLTIIPYFFIITVFRSMLHIKRIHTNAN